MSHGPRKAGSVRFDPYYKVQWWDERSLTWRDIQEAHPTEDDARAHIIEHLGPERQYRIMEVTMTGRSPLPSTG